MPPDFSRTYSKHYFSTAFRDFPRNFSRPAFRISSRTSSRDTFGNFYRTTCNLRMPSGIASEISSEIPPRILPKFPQGLQFAPNIIPVGKFLGVLTRTPPLIYQGISLDLQRFIQTPRGIPPECIFQEFSHGFP